MIRFLRIKRLAVIDSVEVEFESGFNVLTGETGAGKSILVEAVGLLLGGRASGDLVRTGEESASVEAIFESGGEELLIRREITAQGRSRAFINGELAPVGALKERAAQLVELHGQYEHQTLLDPATHLAALDAFAGLNRSLGPTVAEAYHSYRVAADELSQLHSASAERTSREELARFQLAEIDRIAPVSGEDDELTALRQVLANTERVQRLCTEGYGALYENDNAVLAELGGVWRRVAELATLDQQFAPYLEAHKSIKSQLEDLALFLRSYLTSLDTSPGRLQQVEERLALLERLKRKYGPSLADVIARRDALRHDLEVLAHADERLAVAERAHEEARHSYLTAARELSDRRRRAAVEFCRALERQLKELAMDRTEVEVRFAPARPPESSWAATGIDQAELFISLNPGEQLRPLARVASGGELSRIMLALKTELFAARLQAAGSDPAGERLRGQAAPGLVFDEVDAGVGGRVADVVGAKLRALGSAFQVLCITHLPQIAACADTHFHIEKRVEAGRTRTTVVRLGEAARIEEIGRMLAGAAVSDAVRTSAREMLTRREAKGETKEKGESESARKLGVTSRSRGARQ